MPKGYSTLFHFLFGVFSILGCAITSCSTDHVTPPLTTFSPMFLPSPSATEWIEPQVTVARETPTPKVEATTVEAFLPTTSPTQEIFQMCSPLAWESIPELFEIVSDPYHPPPPNRAEERHHGVDFSHYTRKQYKSIEGEPVQSVVDGKVASAIQDRPPYGNMVIIETPGDQLPQALRQQFSIGRGQSLYVLYAHLASSPPVSLGDSISCGQEIGQVGASGYNIVNAHLHLETRIGPSSSVFPSMAFYTTSASQAEMENYIRWRTGGEFVHFDPMSLFQWYLDFIDLAEPPISNIR